MRTIIGRTGVALLLGLSSGLAMAMPISLAELEMQVDGEFTDLFIAPDEVNCDANTFACAVLLDSSGLGTIDLEISGAGAHRVGVRFDYNIIGFTESVNESGEVIGSPPPDGLSWEIDEPGFGGGDIFDNFSAGFLDNSNGVPPMFEDDVSTGLLWDFVLLTSEVASIRFSVSDVVPTMGFALVQRDTEEPEFIVFSTQLVKSEVPPPVVTISEPPLLLLFVLLPLLVLRRSSLR